MVVNAELEAAIERELDDDERFLVYADWLQQQGDPRGELAAVQHAIGTATGAKLDELRVREQALLSTHRDALLGPLGPVIASASEAYRHRTYSTNGVDPVWRFGFLDSFRITMWESIDTCFVDEDRERWPELVKLLPDIDDDFDVRTLLRLVAGSPASRFLRRLRFGDTVTDYGPGYDVPSAKLGPSLLDTLVELAVPTLRVLELGAMDCRRGETELSWIALGNVGKVLRAYPRLREVVLSGAGQHFDAGNYGDDNPMRLELGAIDMPELRRFELRTTDLRKSQLASIIAARWPALERLVVWFGSTARQGAECVVDDVLPLLERSYPRLRHLALKNAEFTDDLVDVLAASPLLEQLETLDLSLGCLTDDGARELRDHEPAFKHLARLVLDRCELTDAGIAAVNGLCREVSIVDQRERERDDEEDDDDDDEDVQRYVAVGE